MKPNARINRSGMAYHAVGTGTGEIANLPMRASQFTETTSLLEDALLQAILSRPFRLQLVSSARQSGHHRADRHADDIGDFAIGQLVHFTQDDDFATGWRQALDLLVEPARI